MKKGHLAVACLMAATLLEGVSETASADTSAEGTKTAYTVYTDRKGKSISPYIYGINDAVGLRDVTATALKQSDVAVSAYNWENNFSNSGAEAGNTNDVSLVKGYSASMWSRPALYTDILVSHADRFGNPVKLVTLQMMGRVAADSIGVVSEEDLTSRWSDISFVKEDVYNTEPDGSDGIVYIDEYLAYLVNKYSTADDGGIYGYFLDREPDKWAENFPYTGLPPVTPDEYTDKAAQLAQSVKMVDPAAMVFGPSVDSISGSINLGNEKAWESIARSDEYLWFIDYYLSQMKKASDKAGIRLLDVLDIHYYTEAATQNGTSVLYGMDELTDETRMQATRTLWDAGFTENSVTALRNKEFTPFIPALQSSIRLSYPDTKLSFSEYSFGGGTNMSGAIAEIDTLGIFAEQEVYLACLEPDENCDFQVAALDLFTNYDGYGSRFGDILLEKEGGTDHDSLWCSEDGSGTLTLIVTNQNKVMPKTFDITLDTDRFFQIKSAWSIDHENADIYELNAGDFDMEGNFITFTSDTTSAYLLVLEEFAEEVTSASETESSSSEKAGDVQAQPAETSVTAVTEDGPTLSRTEMPTPGESGTETVSAVTEAAVPVTGLSGTETASPVTEEADKTVLTETTDIVEEEKDPKVSAAFKVIVTMLAAAASFMLVYVLLGK